MVKSFQNTLKSHLLKNKEFMSEKILVIVESPSKAKKIQEYLGDEYIVTASKGHIVDLTKTGKYNLGIDLENFTPRYSIIEDKISVVNELMKLCKKSKLVLIASDPDREGMAISWHIFERLKDMEVPIKRIIFNEITKKAIKKAISSPIDIDMDLVHAQEARRMLDRIVGFMTSPFLMNSMRERLSAGRVQSVVSKMIIDRESEISAFVSEDFWNIYANITDGITTFTVKYDKKILDENEGKKIQSKIIKSTFTVTDVVSKEEKRPLSPPLITSKLQQIMSKDHGFSADRTMKAAQELYESGYCTYIRTDSVRANDDAVKEVREWLQNQGYDIPDKENTFKNKDASQDAHECIRPTEITLLPYDNYEIIDQDQKKVYEVIWRYFVASQMNPAIYDTLKVTLESDADQSLKFKCSGKSLKYRGALEILNIEDDSKIDIPNLSIGDQLSLHDKKSVSLDKKQTQPPARYSESNLIKELVNKEIGRPATYAELLTKITARNYVEKQGNVYHGTDLGKRVSENLSKYFSFMDYNYTSNMEKKLDDIANKKLNYIEMLKDFYNNFKKELDTAYIDSGCELCEKCNSPLSERKSKTGSFLGCTTYPNCKFTKEIK